MPAGGDLLEVVGKGHPPIDHDRGPAAAAGAGFQRRQHVRYGGPIDAITVEDLVRSRKPVAIQDQPHDDLLAVRPMVARVAALGLRVERTLAFKVRRRQIVEIDGVVEVEQRAFARGQRPLDRRALRMQPVERAIQGVVGQRREVRRENVAQGGAPDPVGHGVLRGRAHQPIERHELREPSGARGQARLGQDRVQRERLPHLMPHVDGADFPGVFGVDLVSVNRDHVAAGRVMAGRPQLRGERVNGGIRDECRLPAERGRELLREGVPLLFGRRGERAERADRAVTRAVRGGDGLDEEMIDIGLAAHPSGRALDEHAPAISLL